MITNTAHGVRTEAETRRKVMGFGIYASLLLSLVICSAANASNQPNILIINTDDQGYSDVGVHGLETVPTPNMDSIAENGMLCTRAYTAPICGPSRAGLMTGIHPSRFGNEFNPGRPKVPADYYSGLRDEIHTIGERLQRAGYHTGWVGKWHLGCKDNPVFHPSNQGFDEWFDHEKGRKKLPPYDIIRNGKKIRATQHATKEMADDGARFIRGNAGRPWFLYYAPNTLHVVIQATDEYRSRVPDSVADPTRREYLASLMMEDDGIGQLLEAIEDTGQNDQTLIFFTSDNGGAPNTGASNLPLRGNKTHTLEGGIRVPFFIQWNGIIPAGARFEHPINHVDILPTALAAAGKPLPHQEAATGTPTDEDRIDGVNLLPYLTGEKEGAPHENMFFRFGEQFALIRGDWKLVLSEGIGDTGKQRTLKYHEIDPRKGWLVNLADDPSEEKNVAAEYPKIFEEMATQWELINFEMPEPAFSYTGNDRYTHPSERKQ